MTIRNKFILGYSTSAVLLGAVGLGFLFNMVQINSQLQHTNAKNLPAIFILNEMTGVINESITDIYSYTTANNLSSKQEFGEKIEKYNSLERQYIGVNEKEDAVLAKIHETKEDYVQTAESAFVNYDKTHKLSIGDLQNLQAKANLVHSALSELSVIKTEETKEIYKKIEATTQNTIKAAVVIALIVGLFAGSIAIWMWMAIIKSVQALQGVVNAVAKSDLSKRVQKISKDELGNLAAVFNQMLDNIQKSHTDLQEAEGQLKETNTSLEGKLAELEKFQALTVGRELKMVELKEEIEKLKKGQDK